MPPLAQNPVVLTFEKFAWVAGRSEAGGPKATWQGPGKRDDLYGQDALRAIAAQGRQGTPASRLRQQTAAVGRAAVRGGIGDAATALGRSVRNEIGRPAINEVRELGGATKTLAAVPWKVAKTGIRIAREVDKRTGEVMAHGLDGIVKAIDKLQSGTASRLPRLHRAMDWLATARIPKIGVLGENVRMWHSYLNLASAGARLTGASRAALTIAQNTYGYYTDAYRANKIRWGRIPAQFIEIATFIAHKFLSKAAIGAVIGTASGIGPVAGAVGGLVAGVASLGVPSGLSVTGAMGVKAGGRYAATKTTELVLGEGKSAPDVREAKAEKYKTGAGEIAAGKKKRRAAQQVADRAKIKARQRALDRARQRIASRKAARRGVVPHAETAPVERLTLASLIRAIRDRIGEPVPVRTILATLTYLTDGGAETFAEFETFAFDPANYTKTEKGTYRSKGGRTLSAAQYAAAAQRFQQRAKGGEGAKPPAKPPEKSAPVAASPQPSGLAAGMAKLNQQRADEAKRNGQTRLSGIYEERSRQWASGERKPSSTTGAAPPAKPPVSPAVQEKVARRIDSLVQEEDAILGKFGLRTIQDEDRLRQIDAEVKRLHAAVAPKPTPAPQAKPNPPQKPKPAAAMTTGAPMLGGIPRADFLRRVDELKKGGVSGFRAAVLVSQQIREQQASPKEPPPLGVKPMVAGLGGMAAGSAIGAAVGGPLGAGVGAVIGGPVAAYAARKLFGSPDKPIGTAKPDGSGPTWKDWVAEVGVQAIAKSAGLLTAAVTVPTALGYGAAMATYYPVGWTLGMIGGMGHDWVMKPFESLIIDAPIAAHNAAKQLARRAIGGVSQMAEGSVSMLDAMTTAVLARLEHLAAQAGKPMPAIDPAALKQSLIRAMVTAKKAMRSQTSGQRPAT